MTRTDVHEIPYEEMTPVLRALIAYEPNRALDREVPQVDIDKVRDEFSVVRWERGVGFFQMDDVVAAARNPHLVSTDPVTNEPFGMGSAEPMIPLHLDGALHKHYRRLLDPLFTPPKMALLQDQVRTLADELIDRFIDDGHVELHDAFCVPLPSIIFLQLFGMPLDDLEVLNEKKNEILKNDGTTVEEWEAKGRQAGAELDVLLRTRLMERHAEQDRRTDLLDTFMHFEVDGHGLNDDEIVNLMHMFTIAGLDTVTSSLSCIFAWLAKHPDERRRLVAEPELIGRAIEEIMRYESPVPSGGGRWVTADTEVNGVELHKGDMIYLCWASANLDPKAFERPLEVDLGREVNSHIAFAAGFHRCLGSHLARAELRTAVDQFHRRIPDYWITAGDDAEYEFAGVRQAKRVPLTFA